VRREAGVAVHRPHLARAALGRGAHQLVEVGVVADREHEVQVLVDVPRARVQCPAGEQHGALARELLHHRGLARARRGEEHVPVDGAAHVARPRAGSGEGVAELLVQRAQVGDGTVQHARVPPPGEVPERLLRLAERVGEHHRHRAVGERLVDEGEEAPPQLGVAGEAVARLAEGALHHQLVHARDGHRRRERVGRSL
jgi:hypothetical protein